MTETGGRVIEMPQGVVLRASGEDPRTKLLWYDFEKVGGVGIRVYVLDNSALSAQNIEAFLVTWAAL